MPARSGNPHELQLALHLMRAFLVLGIGIGIFRYFVATKPEPRKVAEEDKGVLVATLSVSPTTQRVAVLANGQVIPAQRIALSAGLAGRIVSLSEKLIPGGRVRAGARVARIDARDFSLALQEQVAQVDNARTALEIERNRKAVAEREWKLLGRGVPANSVALRDPQLKNARAALKAAESGLRLARRNVRKAVIRAPFNAMVQQKSVDIGQMVGPQTPLAVLVGTDAYWVQMSIPVDRLHWIQIPGVGGVVDGSPAIIKQTVGNTMVEHRGQVVQLLGDLDPIGHMARVLVEIPDPLGLQSNNRNGTPVTELPLLLGSYVSVEITGKEMDNVVEIARTALRGGDRVFVMASDGTLDIRKVEVVWHKRDTVLIGSGLNSGDHVIVSPLGKPVAGMKLRKEAEPAAHSNDDGAEGEATKPDSKGDGERVANPDR